MKLTLPNITIMLPQTLLPFGVPIVRQKLLNSQKFPYSNNNYYLQYYRKGCVFWRMLFYEIKYFIHKHRLKNHF